MKTVLTIAGSDSSGGAGIQADIKTMAAHRVYAMSVITALTAQNTTGVFGVLEAGPDFVALQMDCVFKDIFPDAVKIGMVSNSAIIEAIARKLREYGARHIVADPVMVSTSGGKLLDDAAAGALISSLLPLAELVTPNMAEASVLAGFPVKDENDMLRAAEAIGDKLHTAVLVKGGHLPDEAADLLWRDGETAWFTGPRIDNPNTHGTGCTLSSAIACHLAKGDSLEQSVAAAKAYLSGALRAGLNLGQGAGPLDHGYNTQICSK